MNETLQQALMWLAKRERDVQREYGRRDKECHEQVQSRHNFRPIDEWTLQVLLEQAPRAGDVHSWGTWLFLPAPTRGSLRIPVLNVLYDYDQNPPEVSLQAAIFYPAEKGPLAAGWRFESPEHPGESNNQSTHGFYHAQPGHRLRTEKGDHPLPVANREIPEGQPTIPLDAENEVDLLICLLLSIYGLTEGTELIRGVNDPALAGRLGRLRTVGSSRRA